MKKLITITALLFLVSGCSRGISNDQLSTENCEKYKDVLTEYQVNKCADMRGANIGEFKPY